MKKCNISKSDFENAKFINTNFSGSNCRSAYLSGTAFYNCDLSKIKYLTQCDHGDKSSIDSDTIKRTKERLPDEFLRDVGFLKWEVELNKLHISDLNSAEITDIIYEVYNLKTSKPIQFYSCFISYSHQDEKFARSLHRRLQSDGLHVYFAPHNMLPGKKIKDQIDDAVIQYDKLLLILSEKSIKSNWVMYELRKAYETEINSGQRMLFPVSIVDYEHIRDWKCFDDEKAIDYAKEVRSYYIPDLKNWKNKTSFNKEYKKLIKALNSS
jgi:hypothetical protein